MLNLNTAKQLTKEEIAKFLSHLNNNSGLWSALASIGINNIAPIHRAMHDGAISREFLGDYKWVPYIIGIAVRSENGLTTLARAEQLEMISIKTNDMKNDDIRFMYLSKVTGDYVIYYSIPVARVVVRNRL